MRLSSQSQIVIRDTVHEIFGPEASVAINAIRKLTGILQPLTPTLCVGVGINHRSVAQGAERSYPRSHALRGNEDILSKSPPRNTRRPS
jgi:hypothetical protein